MEKYVETSGNSFPKLLDNTVESVCKGPVDVALMGRIGMELTVTNNTLIEFARQEDQLAYDKEYNRLFDCMNHIIETCSNTRISIHGITIDQWKLRELHIHIDGNQGDDGIDVCMHSDDWVIEFTATPMTLTQLIEYRDCLECIVYESTARLGLCPHTRIGGGHIHFETQTHFGSDGATLRNFLVDMNNRPELFLGGLSFDLLNAPPICILHKAQQDAFRDVVSEFDHLEHPSIEWLCANVNTRVYNKSFVRDNTNVWELTYFRKWPQKFQLINLLHKHTIELRGLRPQKSVKELIALASLFQTRVIQIAADARRIPIAFRDMSGDVSVTVERNMETYHTTTPMQQHVKLAVVALIHDCYPDRLHRDNAVNNICHLNVV